MELLNFLNFVSGQPTPHNIPSRQKWPAFIAGLCSGKPMSFHKPLHDFQVYGVKSTLWSSIGDDLRNKGGVLFISLAEAYNGNSTKGMKTHLLELKLKSTQEEKMSLGKEIDNLKNEIGRVDESKLEGEAKEQFEQKKKDLRDKEVAFDVVGENETDFEEQVKRSMEKVTTEEDRKEYRDTLIEMKLAEIVNFGIECLEDGASISDIGDYVCGGIFGRNLWTITMYTGGGFASFGPKKLAKLGDGGKGGTKGSQTLKGIKTSEDGLALPRHLQGKSQQVLDILRVVVRSRRTQSCQRLPSFA